MTIRVMKTAEIDPETLQTVAKETLYHLFVDGKEVASSPDTYTMRQFINIYKSLPAVPSEPSKTVAEPSKGTVKGTN